MQRLYCRSTIRGSLVMSSENRHVLGRTKSELERISEAEMGPSVGFPDGIVV
jgi:hypothetical protein